ncbi:MAG TPA: NAD(+)/NADH kinase [Thermoleophilaceae bacterium]|jgi:NAD+ kinase|nr:NAD(+)/NADH kinase [Thermoleophilaceae bacterium]
MSGALRIALLTHQRVGETRDAVGKLVKALADAGGEVVVSREENEKLGVDGCTVVDNPATEDVDAAVVMGGDGTMLAALREFAGTGAPVFTFNFGAVGFLATIEPDRVDDGIRRLIEGDFETLELPTLAIEPSAGRRIAVNDVAFLRRSGSRVAQLAYSVRGEKLASARCDGLVVSTPVGSTGYNLANGGPVVAWGVEGYIVSYIAPHTLTARTLVAATTDILVVSNLAEEEPVDVETDGKRVCTLEPGQNLEVTFNDHPALLAKVSGTGFYDQLTQKFGRLAS